jgi:hypothetical protein
MFGISWVVAWASQLQACEFLLNMGAAIDLCNKAHGTESDVIDKAMLEKIESVYFVSMQEEDERQRQVLIECGIIQEDQG